jgi:hypothetical protein
VAIGDFDAHAVGVPAVSLGNRHVERRFGVMDGALRDQVERTALWSVVAPIDLDVMVARYSLILAAAERSERPAIQSADEVRDVFAVVVGGMSNLARSGYRCETKFRGWNYESFVNVDFRAGRMVHCHQRNAIVIVDFPKFRGDAQVVVAIVWNELITPDFVPLAGSCDFRRAERIDTQPNRRSPRNRVLYEFHFRTIPREKKRTGSFQPLLGDNFLVSFHAKFRTHRAVWPNHAHDFCARLVAETKVKLWPGNRLFLNQQTRTNFDFTADTKRIDALIADSLLCMRPYHLPVVVFRTMIYTLCWQAMLIETKKIEAPTAAQVRNIKNSAEPWRVVQKGEFRCCNLATRCG